jgi:hypothetical protein
MMAVVFHPPQTFAATLICAVIPKVTTCTTKILTTKRYIGLILQYLTFSMFLVQVDD